MERELGLTLLDRNSKGVTLTDAGTRFLAEAAAVLARHDEAMANMERVRTGSVGMLNLGISPGVNPAILRALLGFGVQAGNAAEVVPRAVTSGEGFGALARNELDAILVHAVPASGSNFSSLLLASDVLGVAVPSGSWLARLRSVRPEQLCGEPLVWMQRTDEPELHNDVLDVLREAGFHAGPLRHTPNVETSLSLVAAGLGISFKLGYEVLPRSHPGVVWKPFSGVRIDVPTSLAWNRGDRSPLLSRLVRTAQSLVETE